MEEHKLEIAKHKAEAILLIGKKRLRQIEFKIKWHAIIPKNAVKYQRVVLNNCASFTKHVTYAVNRAKEAAAGLARILPRLEEATDSKRKILSLVVESILLYACQI
ncbi:hypothetical protein Zmor_023485 [Zophobas morio]|uniref:Uncharacterized protein n=1 Tax=Zophobas morio TaxID=2755281 RepID=A0AA38M7W1_9CUCU|nr:hypothetical protein Zmor_023485 [Zophobas morio]